MENKLGFFGVIRESIKTTSRNRKLILPILLLVFLTYSQVDFLQEYTLAPFTEYFMWQWTNHPNIVHDIVFKFDQTSYAVDTIDTFREIVVLKLLGLEIFSILTLMFLVATVCSSYESYTAKVLGPKEFFIKFCKSWNRSLFTSFYLILLSIGITFFYAIIIGITAFLAVNSWAVLVLNSWGLVFIGVVTLSIPICYFYMATFWMVSLVVSVLEDGSSGIKAIARASELMKGKRLQAIGMMVLITLCNGFVVVVAKVVASYGWRLSTELAITIPFTNGVYCLLKVFMFVVYTVYYHEWKTSHGEKEGKGFYLPVSNVKA